MAQLTRKGTSPNVNVTLLKKTGFEGKTLPCQLCRKALEIRLSKNLKPYCVCNDCSIQVFFRGENGNSSFAGLVNSQKSIPDGEINSDSAVEIFASLENLKLQRSNSLKSGDLFFAIRIWKIPLAPLTKKSRNCKVCWTKWREIHQNGRKMKPAVIYARVSSKDQEREGYSIPAQQKLVREYAQKTGFQIVREFVDVETAKTAGRKQFGEMVQFLRKEPLVQNRDCGKDGSSVPQSARLRHSGGNGT